MSTKTMQSIPNSVRWYEGMVIDEQYFQSAFHRAEELTRFRISTLKPYLYGVIKLKINEGMLSHSVFKLNELECIMPDGLEVNYLAGTDRALEVNLSEYREQIQKGPNKIFLCVPFGRQIGQQNAKYARFYAIPTQVIKDSVTNGEYVGVPSYKANLSLQIGTIPPSEFISIPIAIVNLDKNKYELNPYTPPSLLLERGCDIFILCEKILNLMKVKYEILVNQYKKTFLDLDKSLNDIFHLINIIRQIIPKLELILNLPYISPFELYSEMVNVYSQIICIDRSFSREIVPRYDHENILEIFTLLTRFITDHVEVEVPDHFSVCYFEKYQDCFRINISSVINSDELIIGFRRIESYSEESFVNFVQSLLICERNNYSAMRETRSLGFERKYIKAQEGLFLSKNICLFSIGIKKEHIQKNSEIVIFSNSNDFQNLEKNSIILYTKDKS